MNTFFYDKRISGVLGILPETVKYYEDELIDGFSKRNQMIKKNMGYGKRYHAKPTTTTADLCMSGLQYLFDKKLIDKEDISAIIVATFTPDYFVPQISTLIHQGFGFSSDVFNLDIWAGCSGYVEGLLQAFLFLETNPQKKVLLFTGDVINRMEETIYKYDEPYYGGDGASISIVENSPSQKIPFLLMCDGKGKDLITFQQGAFADIYHRKLVSTVQNNPTESFRYFQEKVPNLIERLLEYGSIKKEDIDHYFLIHANKLAPLKMADRLQISREAVSSDIVEKYGDISASLNPVSIIDYYGEKMLKKQTQKVVLCGYGAGARWGATVMDIGNMNFCENYYTDL